MKIQFEFVHPRQKNCSLLLQSTFLFTEAWAMCYYGVYHGWAVQLERNKIQLSPGWNRSESPLLDIGKVLLRTLHRLSQVSLGRHNKLEQQYVCYYKHSRALQRMLVARWRFWCLRWKSWKRMGQRQRVILRLMLLTAFVVYGPMLWTCW